MQAVPLLFAASALFAVPPAPSASRLVHIDGRTFVLASSNESIVLSGPNVVVKGPPYLPTVAGTAICNDTPESPEAGCIANPKLCKSCSTFNQADVDHIKSRGWNSIRLGVIWAGAQPRDEGALDPAFVERLHAVLNLTDRNGLHVVLDNHGDMVGSAGCGNGVPMWLQVRAAPELIGKPLRTALPYSLIPSISVVHVDGYEECGEDETRWAQHAADPNFNLLNECCQAMNSGNPGGLGFTTISQKTMDYILRPGAGRDAFVRYWRLMAEAVAQHPSAFAAELMNEPMSIHRRWMFDTWRACAEAIVEVVPDMAVSICDTGEGSVLPAWISTLTGGAEDISRETMAWIKSTNSAFYAWHYGSTPDNIRNMQAISKEWNVPTFATETGCDQFDAAAAANISHSYWHYSSYCNTGPWFGNRSVPTESFGACILGWASGNSSKC
jgi:hypothetical protein